MMQYLKEEIKKYSRLSYQRGLVGAAGGNISMRYEDAFLITAGGISLRDITENEILLVDQNGKILEGKQGLKPSKETIMHLKVYKARENVDSIIHVHSPYATGYSIKKHSIPIITASAKMKLIEVPVVPYANPGTVELAENVEKNVKNCPDYIKAVLLECHGIIAFDKGLGNCFDVAELVEDTAKIAFISENIK
ncbi:MAG: L-fuculose-phosphate aldolase [Clostridiales bacterium]|jgi:L-fuculose-phosphate aldolase|nr:L-fuculose-phosphate aldolase [Clostridiales bacterium]MDK2933642.1 L-fuculose-phosphate aldolase [Clostridiales bacterium]